MEGRITKMQGVLQGGANEVAASPDIHKVSPDIHEVSKETRATTNVRNSGGRDSFFSALRLQQAQKREHELLLLLRQQQQQQQRQPTPPAVSQPARGGATASALAAEQTHVSQRAAESAQEGVREARQLQRQHAKEEKPGNDAVEKRAEGPEKYGMLMRKPAVPQAAEQW